MQVCGSYEENRSKCIVLGKKCLISVFVSEFHKQDTVGLQIIGLTCYLVGHFLLEVLISVMFRIKIFNQPFRKFLRKYFDSFCTYKK